MGDSPARPSPALLSVRVPLLTPVLVKVPPTLREPVEAAELKRVPEPPVTEMELASEPVVVAMVTLVKLSSEPLVVRLLEVDCATETMARPPVPKETFEALTIRSSTTAPLREMEGGV